MIKLFDATVNQVERTIEIEREHSGVSIDVRFEVTRDRDGEAEITLTKLDRVDVWHRNGSSENYVGNSIPFAISVLAEEIVDNWLYNQRDDVISEGCQL